jgi:hypothetical protein
MQVRAFEYFTGTPGFKFKAELYKSGNGAITIQDGWGSSKDEAIEDAIWKLKKSKGIVEDPPEKEHEKNQLSLVPYVFFP